MKQGKFYQFKSNKTVVLCTENNLEVFSGVVIKVGKKDKYHKIGVYCENWNTNADWKEIKYNKIFKN